MPQGLAGFLVCFVPFGQEWSFLQISGVFSGVSTGGVAVSPPGIMQGYAPPGHERGEAQSQSEGWPLLYKETEKRQRGMPPPPLFFSSFQSQSEGWNLFQLRGILQEKRVYIIS